VTARSAPVRLGGWGRRDMVALAVLATVWTAAIAAMRAGGVSLADPIGVDQRRVARIRERIDPNTASAASLRRLPTIGPAKAAAIIAFRAGSAGLEATTPAERGRAFTCCEDLTRVPGIGPGTVARICRQLSLPARPAPHGGASPQAGQ